MLVKESIWLASLKSIPRKTGIQLNCVALFKVKSPSHGALVAP